MSPLSLQFGAFSEMVIGDSGKGVVLFSELTNPIIDIIIIRPAKVNNNNSDRVIINSS